MRTLQRNLKQSTATFLFISHTKNVFLFKFFCIIFIDVKIIKEMPGSLASGTHCISMLRSSKPVGAPHLPLSIKTYKIQIQAL